MNTASALSAVGQTADFFGFVCLAFEWYRAIGQTREADIQHALDQRVSHWSATPEEVARKKPGIAARVDRDLQGRKSLFIIGLALVLIGFGFQIAGSLATLF